ncbi:ribokinase-like protein [Trichodelitschia bisporula]|uniref:Ribokinase n=1 Tax=Trichodelitschia bisporula TaxID=703511 RepID=A0A6G1I4T9_9PEZI|nr:ribokinase-like protein [Trichodelitschia bisporula]
MVTVTPRLPKPGETLRATSFDVGWGGKGANQAVAALRSSRLRSQTDHSPASAPVRMIGAVGADQFGPAMLNSLEADGMDVQGVKVIEGAQTGTAVIMVEEGTGENCILFTPGANFALTPSDALVMSGDYGDLVLFQLETPLDVVLYHIRRARASGAQVILNPAPAQALPLDIYRDITHLILNQSEAELLAHSFAPALADPSDLDALAARFIELGVRYVVVTLGAEGAFFKSAALQKMGMPGIRQAAPKVKVVDTTGAGDTFVGAYAVRVAAAGVDATDATMTRAMVFAQKAASKATQNKGAQSSIPWLNEISTEI